MENEELFSLWKHISWFDMKWKDVQNKKLFDSMNNFVLLCRRKTLIHTFFYNKMNYNDTLQLTELESGLVPNTKAKTFIVPPQLKQSASKVYENILVTDNYVNKIRQSKELKNNATLSFFAKNTFPAAFCYFIIPEKIQEAVSLIKTLANSKLDNYTVQFASSFFYSAPCFVETLCDSFFEKIENSLQKSAVLSSLTIYKIFIDALKLSTYYLQPEHAELSQFFVEKNCSFFINLIVNEVLLPAINEYSLHILDAKVKTVVKQLNIILAKAIEADGQGQSSVVFIIRRSFCRRSMSDNQIKMFGGLRNLNIAKYFVYTSVKEILLFVDIDNPITPRPSFVNGISKLKEEDRKKFTNFLAELYPSRLPFLDEADLNVIDEFAPRPLDDEADDFISRFNLLQTKVTEKGKDMYSEFFINDPSSFLNDEQLKNYRRVKSAEFIEYMKCRLWNNYMEKIDGFNHGLSYIQLTDYFDGLRPLQMNFITLMIRSAINKYFSVFDSPCRSVIYQMYHHRVENPKIMSKRVQTARSICTEMRRYSERWDNNITEKEVSDVMKLYSLVNGSVGLSENERLFLYSRVINEVKRIVINETDADVNEEKFISSICHLFSEKIFFQFFSTLLIYKRNVSPIIKDIDTKDMESNGILDIYESWSFLIETFSKHNDKFKKLCDAFK